MLYTNQYHIVHVHSGILFNITNKKKFNLTLKKNIFIVFKYVFMHLILEY